MGERKCTFENKVMMMFGILSQDGFELTFLFRGDITNGKIRYDQLVTGIHVFPTRFLSGEGATVQQNL